MDGKEVTDYFRSNIFEAYSSYTLWKMIACSRSTGIVSKEMAERYVEIQNYHSEFFIITERAALISFIILLLHPFDKNSGSYSFYVLDKTKTEAFILENKDTVDKLFLVRNKVFAHRDKEVTKLTQNDYPVPSINDLDIFFDNLTKFYNELSSHIDGSTTIFSNAVEIKHDVENLFMNLYRGEKIRKNEIDIDWLWDKDNAKISDVI